MGAVSEADRHNIRGERISIDTIPLVGEKELAAAVRAVTRLPRVKILVLAGAMMGGEIAAAVEDVRADGLRVISLNMAGPGARRRGLGGQRPGAGRRDGRHGRRRHGSVRPDATGQEAVLTRS